MECTERSFFEGMSTSVANHSSAAMMAPATPSNASIVNSVVWRGKVNRFLIVCTFVQECVTSYSQHTYWRFCRKCACMGNGARLTSLRTVRKHALCFEAKIFRRNYFPILWRETLISGFQLVQTHRVSSRRQHFLWLPRISLGNWDSDSLSLQSPDFSQITRHQQFNQKQLLNTHMFLMQAISAKFLLFLLYNQRWAALSTS